MKMRTFFIAVGLVGLMLGGASTAAGNDSGCVNSWGYWLNHSQYLNLSGDQRDPGWDIIGEDTQFFSNYEDAPANTDTLTWYEVLLIPPKGGNAYVVLAHQYVAAYLNIYGNGADPASLGTVMADVEALLTYYSTGLGGTYPPTIPRRADHFTADDRAWAQELASLFDQFNNGYIGPGSCVCPCWTEEDLSNLTASSCTQAPDNEYISVATVQNFTLSTSDSASPECNVLDFSGEYPIGFALAIKYGQFLDCRDGLEKLIGMAGIVCGEP